MITTNHTKVISSLTVAGFTGTVLERVYSTSPATAKLHRRASAIMPLIESVRPLWPINGNYESNEIGRRIMRISRQLTRGAYAHELTSIALGMLGEVIDEMRLVRVKPRHALRHRARVEALEAVADAVQRLHDAVDREGTDYGTYERAGAVVECWRKGMGERA